MTQADRVRHVKRGSEYEILFRGVLLQTDLGLVDNDPVVIYRSLADGRVWARCESEMNDGRFEDVAAVPETAGLPPGILQAYRDAYNKAFTRANHMDAHVAGMRAALALGQLLADPDTLPPYDERPRIEIGAGYHAQAGETRGHLHDVYTTRGELYGYDRIYVGSLMRVAVEELAAACAPAPPPRFIGDGLEPISWCEGNRRDRTTPTCPVCGIGEMQACQGLLPEEVAAQAPDKAGARDGVDRVLAEIAAQLSDPREAFRYREAGARTFEPGEFAEFAANYLGAYRTQIGSRNLLIRAACFIITELRRLEPAPTPTGAEAGRGVVPAGWKLVPEAFTDELSDACKRIGIGPNLGRDMHRAMLAATPTPPVSPSPFQINRIGDQKRGVEIILKMSEWDSEAHRSEEPFPGMVVTFDPDGSILDISIEDLAADMAPPVSSVSPSPDSMAPAGSVERVEVPFAYCCSMDPATCDCVNPNHGTAWIDQRDASASAVPGEATSFQARALALFEGAIGDDPSDLTERRDRFGEEALELQQALGQSREDAHALVDYVFGRPVGEPGQEIGGTQATLALLASYAGHDLMDCAEADIARWADPAFITRLRMKRAGRHGRGPLPGATPGEATSQEGGPVPQEEQEDPTPCSWCGGDGHSTASADGNCEHCFGTGIEQ